MSSSCAPGPAASATYEVQSLSGTVTPVTVDRDSLLSSLLQEATPREPPAVAPSLRLCFACVDREPDLLSVVSPDVLSAVTIREFLGRQSTEGKRFSIVLQIPLRCLCRIEPIPCVVSHATTFNSVQRQFFAIWHRRHQLPVDAGRTFVCCTDHSRSTEWESVKGESAFIAQWLLHGAQSPLPVRVRDAADGEKTEQAHEAKEGVSAAAQSTTGDASDRMETTQPPTTASPPPALFPLYVQTLSGKTINLHAHAESTVEQLKGMIESSESIPRVQQRLIFAGKQLEDGRTLAHYHIREGHMVHLVLRLC